jgi:tetratricopeptide (TPR) repeat protein
MEANIGLAEASSDPAEALKHYQNASRYPENLEVAPREPNLRGFLYYPMAKLHRQLGQQDQAEELLKVTAEEASEYPTVADFYRALALRDLGREAEAAEVLSRLETEARAMLDGSSEAYSRMEDDESNALSRYYLAKVFEAKEEPEPARQNLEAANSLVPGIERRAIMLAQRVYARAHQ